MSDPIIIEVKVQRIDRPDGDYLVSLFDPDDDMPIAERVTFYPEATAAQMLRGIDLKPVRTRTQYVCPNCGRGDFLATQEKIDGYCTIDVTDDSFKYTSGTNTTRQRTVGVSCECEWRAVVPIDQPDDSEAWVRSMLTAVQVACDE